MKHALTLKTINFLTEETGIFTFTTSDPLEFKPGQFMTFRFKTDKIHPRSYSILSCKNINENNNNDNNHNKEHNNNTELAFCIKLVEKGIGSDKLREAQPGDTFDALGPIGPFVFDENSPTSQNIFISTGTGFVPLYAMIQEYVIRYPEQDFTLVFGARFYNELYFHKELLELDEEFENFTYIPVLSRQSHEGCKKGYVQEHLPDTTDSTCYVCGQKPMVMQTVAVLESKGVKNIRIERYS
jgi:NAD(P)H-flavin reductase